MKYIRTVTTLLLLLFNVDAFSGTLSLPANINGQTYIFKVLNLKNAENPNAGMMYKMHFSQTEYTYEDTNQKVHGSYTYQLLDPQNGIALITCHELYNNKPSNYSLLLKAKNIQRGMYIYEQTAFKQRMNFGYYLLDQS